MGAMPYLRSPYHEVALCDVPDTDARFGHFINRMKLLIAIRISDIYTRRSVYRVSEYGSCHEIDAGFPCNKAAALRDAIKETPYTLYDIRKFQIHRLHSVVENAGEKKFKKKFLRATRLIAIHQVCYQTGHYSFLLSALTLWRRNFL